MKLRIFSIIIFSALCAMYVKSVSCMEGAEGKEGKQAVDIQIAEAKCQRNYNIIRSNLGNLHTLVQALERRQAIRFHEESRQHGLEVFRQHTLTIALQREHEAVTKARQDAREARAFRDPEGREYSLLTSTPSLLPVPPSLVVHETPDQEDKMSYLRVRLLVEKTTFKPCDSTADAFLQTYPAYLLVAPAPTPATPPTSFSSIPTPSPHPSSSPSLSHLARFRSPDVLISTPAPIASSIGFASRKKAKTEEPEAKVSQEELEEIEDNHENSDEEKASKRAKKLNNTRKKLVGEFAVTCTNPTCGEEVIILGDKALKKAEYIAKYTAAYYRELGLKPHVFRSWKKSFVCSHSGVECGFWKTCSTCKSRRHIDKENVVAAQTAKRSWKCPSCSSTK